jgi:DNA-binding NtrC family response regulator
LRDRGEDTVALAELFLGRVCRDYGLEVFLADDAARAILNHTWPGNVRELRNVIERAAHVKRRGALVAADLRLSRGRASAPARGFDSSSFVDRTYDEIHAEIDGLLLSRLLEEHDHNISHMSQRLGISRDKLRSRLRELGLYSRS